MSTAKNPPVYTVPNGSAWNDVFLWFFSMALHQDGVPRDCHSAVTIQVSGLADAGAFHLTNLCAHRQTQDCAVCDRQQVPGSSGR